MKALNRASLEQRRTYKVELVHSLLWECALGIAAVTYREIYPTLEKPASYWEDRKAVLPEKVVDELDFVEKHNTWKTLLQLLHQRDFPDLEAFLSFVQTENETKLRYESLPYLDEKQQENRKKAAAGDKAAMNQMIEACSGHVFYPDYIQLICGISIEKLRSHLVNVMRGWYESNIEPEKEQIAGMLRRDYESKQAMLTKLAPEAFVEWATGGLVYSPEPEMPRVLLVPHSIYRPWNVEAELQGVKIFYYPVTDENLQEESDFYRPNLALVQRFKALGDDVRLRIVKRLFERERTLQELTEQLGLAKSTVHHHLSLLRSAKLVTSQGSHYVLKTEMLSVIDPELQQYLRRGPQSEG